MTKLCGQTTWLSASKLKHQILQKHHHTYNNKFLYFLIWMHKIAKKWKLFILSIYQYEDRILPAYFLKWSVIIYLSQSQRKLIPLIDHFPIQTFSFREGKDFKYLHFSGLYETSFLQIVELTIWTIFNHHQPFASNWERNWH